MAEHKYISEDVTKKEEERLALLAGAWKDLIDGVLQARRTRLEAKRAELLGELKKQSGLEVQVKNLKAHLDTKECPTCEQSIPLTICAIQAWRFKYETW